MSITIQLSKQNLFVPNSLGDLNVNFDGRDFFVIDGQNKSFKVQKYDLSKELVEVSSEQLQKYLEFSYLSLNKIGSDYSLKLNQRLLGGGPISGLVAYWATKIVCYGTASAAVGGTIAATGGAVAGALGAVAGGAVGAAGGVGATAVAGGIAGAGGIAAATEATVAFTAAAGTATAAVAAVESASLGVGAFFTAIPFLP